MDDAIGAGRSCDQIFILHTILIGKAKSSSRLFVHVTHFDSLRQKLLPVADDPCCSTVDGYCLCQICTFLGMGDSENYR
jgi:hypothetical protein